MICLLSVPSPSVCVCQQIRLPPNRPSPFPSIASEQKISTRQPSSRPRPLQGTLATVTAWTRARRSPFCSKTTTLRPSTRSPASSPQTKRPRPRDGPRPHPQNALLLLPHSHRKSRPSQNERPRLQTKMKTASCQPRRNPLPAP